MKKFLIVTVLSMLISPVFAQSIPDDRASNMYYINVRVERVYPTGMGYIVQYKKEIGTGIIGIPNEWFTNAAGKAELIALPRGSSWPTMTVFYRDGEFSHVRLYVHDTKGRSTWSNLPQGMDVSRYFESDTIVLEF